MVMMLRMVMCMRRQYDTHPVEHEDFAQRLIQMLLISISVSCHIFSQLQKGRRVNTPLDQLAWVSVQSNEAAWFSDGMG